MATGWEYRLSSAAGTVCLTGGALVAANHPLSQRLAQLVPVFDRLPATTLANGELSLATLTTLVVVLAAFVPLFKPRPRRILDTLVVAEKRVLLAFIALAAVGYFDYTYRLPRTTLVLTGGLLAVALPLWFVAIRWRPNGEADRAVIVGDDPETMADILEAAGTDVLGYVSPPVGPTADRRVPSSGEVPDGGRVTETTSLADLECLGGLSRLEEVLVQHDVDTALLAFARPDRAEFFGTLDTCYEHGVTTKVHRDHADIVLTDGVAEGDLIDVDLEPWDWQDYVFKRAFDVVFAALGLLALSPLLVVIAAAIKLDSEGPVLYSQTRTAELGETFTVYKFRTMYPDTEDATPVDDESNDRITRVGRLLRRTHLDEVPQLWPILWGEMSVVGPRAAWTDEERHLERTADSWRKRWFVKPGLTGLAQINDVTSTEPEEKLRYDVSYIRQQSFWFDLKIVVRQLWIVAVDAVRALH